MSNSKKNIYILLAPYRLRVRKKWLTKRGIPSTTQTSQPPRYYEGPAAKGGVHPSPSLNKTWYWRMKLKVTETFLFTPQWLCFNKSHGVYLCQNQHDHHPSMIIIIIDDHHQWWWSSSSMIIIINNQLSSMIIIINDNHYQRLLSSMIIIIDDHHHYWRSSSMMIIAIFQWSRGRFCAKPDRLTFCEDFWEKQVLACRGQYLLIF